MNDYSFAAMMAFWRLIEWMLAAVVAVFVAAQAVAAWWRNDGDD